MQCAKMPILTQRVRGPGLLRFSRMPKLRQGAGAGANFETTTELTAALPNALDPLCPPTSSPLAATILLSVSDLVCFVCSLAASWFTFSHGQNHVVLVLFHLTRFAY